MESHQVNGVEDLHLADGGAAGVRQVAVVVVDGQRTQACEDTGGRAVLSPRAAFAVLS